MKYSPDQLVFVGFRFVMGFMFFWAFLDKVFGLGFSTPAGRHWLAGVSPAAGFLKGSTGWFAPVFHALAGSAAVDWLFMLGLLLIGLALLLGVGMRIAGVSGAVMVALMWLANFPPAHNPVLDEHTVYLLALLGLAFSNTKPGEIFGLGRVWSQTSMVRKYPFLG